MPIGEARFLADRTHAILPVGLTVPNRSLPRQPLSRGRLAAAFAASPLGVLLLAVVLFGHGVGTPTEWFDGRPNPLIGVALLVGIAYVAGFFLLPVFFLLEHSGRRSWTFYVPIAAAGGVLVGLLPAGPGPLRQRVALSLSCAVAGAACAVVFSVVLTVRPKQPGH